MRKQIAIPPASGNKMSSAHAICRNMFAHRKWTRRHLEGWTLVKVVSLIFLLFLFNISVLVSSAKNRMSEQSLNYHQQAKLTEFSSLKSDKTTFGLHHSNLKPEIKFTAESPDSYVAIANKNNINNNNNLNTPLNSNSNHHAEITSNDSHRQRQLRHEEQLTVRRRLVRELTNLIMNHEFASIQPSEIKVNSEILDNQMADESQLFLFSRTSASAKSHEDLMPHSKRSQDDAAHSGGALGKPLALQLMDSTGSLDITTTLTTLSSDSQQQQEQEQNSLTASQNNKSNSHPPSLTTSEEQYSTCPPDYEDQQTPFNELSKNLTTEQQREMLASADSSGLLLAQQHNNNNNNSLNPSEQEGGSSMPCIQAPNKMIEVITKIITPILFSIIIVVGLLGNIIVMIVILEDRKTERELTPTGLLILDLSLADLSFILFCIPFTGWDYSVGYWVFGLLWCKCTQYLIVVCALSSIYTLVLMSVDRFMAIVYPIECMSYRTSKNTLYAIYIKWVLILLMASPTIAMHGLVESPISPDLCNCRFLSDHYNPLHFQIVFFITSYLFPLILIFCLYLSLLNKLWFGSKPHGHKESVKMLESKKKVTWLVAGIVVVFALCWCPIQVMLILMRLKTHKITATYVAIQVFSHTLGYMNSCVNPIVYAFASETFHNSFKRSSVGRYCYMCFCIINNSHNHNQQQQQQHQQQQQQHHHHQIDHDRSTNFRTIHTTHNNNTTVLIDNHLHDNNLNHEQNSLDRLRGASSVVDLDSANILTNRNGTIDNNNYSNNDSNNSNSTLLTATHPSNNDSILCTNINNSASSSSVRINALPLEPRDRMILVQSPPTGFKTESQPSFQRGDQIVRQQQQVSSTGAATRATTDPTLNNRLNSAKQQLVARIVPSGKTISQRCEPSYQQELENPYVQ